MHITQYPTPPVLSIDRQRQTSLGRVCDGERDRRDVGQADRKNIDIRREGE